MCTDERRKVWQKALAKQAYLLHCFVKLFCRRVKDSVRMNIINFLHNETNNNYLCSVNTPSGDVSLVTSHILFCNY
jgi:hypothetical protein